MLHRALDILLEEGVDLNRVAVGHMYVPSDITVDVALSLFREVLKRDVYLEFDLLGSPGEDSTPTVDAIRTLISDGHAKQILVSQDIYTKFHLSEFGGEGLTYIHGTVIPTLRSQGVSEADIRQIIEDNLRQVLTFVQPKPLLANVLIEHRDD